MSHSVINRMLGLTTAGLLACSPAVAAPFGPVAGPDLKGDFIGEDGKAPDDISGVACAPARAGAPRSCVVVSDEVQWAQGVAISDKKIAPGAQKIDLIEKPDRKKTLGSAPSNLCSGEALFEEFDGEAVAYGGGYVYVTGSHGCGRDAEQFRLSQFILARAPVGAQDAIGQFETTYRLAERLQAQSVLASFVGKNLNTEDGLGIEGMVATGDRLLFGMRSPNRDGVGYIMEADPEQLFAEPGGSAPSATPEPKLHFIRLGKGVGVRDMAPLSDGRLLLITGPTLEQADVQFRLAIVKLVPSTADNPIAPQFVYTLPEPDPKTVPPKKRVKPEAVLVLKDGPGKLDVLVFSDKAKNGRPKRYAGDLP